MISTPIRFETFAGRTRELDHLLERRRAAAGGSGGAVLIGGDPGIGKSRLAAEFCARVPRRTTRVASAAYREFAQRPLGPLLDLLEQIAPAAAERLRVHPGPSRAEHLAAFVDAFTAGAGAVTTVLAIDDLHWADRDSLQVVHALVQSSRSLRLLVVATYRDVEVVPVHANYSLLGKLLREGNVSRVALPPLADGDLAELLRGAAGARAAQLAPLLDVVRRRSDGNAFFAEELLRYALDHDSEPGASGVPMSLQGALRDRVAQCSPGARALLAAASLFGRRFDLAIVRASLVAGDDADDASAGAAVEELVRRGLFEPVDPAPDAFRFRHGLLREAIYDDVEPPERRRLHRRIADAIAARPDAATYVESLAHHLWRAGEHARAAPACLAAAAAARAFHAYDDAAEWYERAARCENDPLARARALAAAGQACGYADALERALAFYREARDVYAGVDAVDDAIFTSVLLAALLHDYGRAGEALAEMRATEETRLARASATARNRFYLRLGFLYASVRRVDEAWECVDAIGAGAFDASSLPAAELSLLQSGLHAQRAEPAAWRAAFERGFSTFEAAGAIPDNLRVALSNAALQGVALGETSIARGYQERALAAARAIGTNVDHECLLLAQMDVQHGDLERARAVLHDVKTADRFATRVERAILAAWLAELTGATGTDEIVDLRLLDEAAASGRPSALVRLSCAFGSLVASLGHDAQAERLFAQAVAALVTAFEMTFALGGLAAHLAVSPASSTATPRADNRGKHALLASVRMLVAPAAERAGARVDRAVLALVDAALARATGEAGAFAHARAAAGAFAELGYPWLEAQAFEIGGDLHRAAQRYASFGASGAVRRIERAALARNGRAPRAAILTPRERELADLVAAGNSNRVSAQRLSVSEKAVEKHLTSIYAKLGLTSRAQLAAFVITSTSEPRS